MQELKINGIYRHFKGDYYLVQKILKLKKKWLYTENCMKIVVYGCVQRKCFYQR